MLQNHQNEEIYKIACNIVDRYFAYNTNQEQNGIAPREANREFQFHPTNNDANGGNQFNF